MIPECRVSEELDAPNLTGNKLDTDVDSLVGVDHAALIQDHADVKRSADAAQEGDVAGPDRSPLDQEPRPALGQDLAPDLARAPWGGVVGVEVDAELLAVDQAREPPAIDRGALTAVAPVPQAQVGLDVDHTLGRVQSR